MFPPALDAFVKSPAAEIYKRADAHCSAHKRRASEILSEYFATTGLESSDFCFVVVGSIGRNEALEASDFDVIPLTKDEKTAESFIEQHDQKIRQALRDALGISVSKGEELTRVEALPSIVKAEKIGGDEDSSASLTKRVLILTESCQFFGGLPIKKVRKDIIDAYGAQERTSGRHVLSLCNDIARYYRTLCVEYKLKADRDGADWCTRNLKLRHSRKLWYFSNILSIVTLSENHPRGKEDYTDELLRVFAHPPVNRLIDATHTSLPIDLGRLLESYSHFLEFMSSNENREALSAVPHDQRYMFSLGNPFPAMKFNSDLLHRNIMQIIWGLPPTTRQRVFDWFLL